MMNSFDLGGCCLARYGAATSYFASKTEQIMSRYRPIAPKPVVKSTAGLPDGAQNQQPQPCPSSFRASTRNRKRNWEAASASASASGAAVPSTSPPPRPHKRAARGRAGAPDVHFEGGHNRLERSSAKSTVVSPALRHSDTSEEAVSPHCEISDSAASKSFPYAGTPFGYSSSSAASSSSFDSAFTQKNNGNGSLERGTDAAFMERAAASVSPSVNLSLREQKSPKQLAVPSESMQSMAMVCRDLSASSVLDAKLLITPESERDDLVTLPLLPIAPYRKETSQSSSYVSNLSSKDSNGNGMQTLCNDVGSHLMPELSLSAHKKMTFVPSPTPALAPAPGPLLDISLLDHIYSASPDPVLVTDDSHSHQVVWYNHAYKRVMASSDLGIPKPLATFSLHKHKPTLKLDNSSSMATLWGFAKKFSPASQDKDIDSPHSHSQKGIVIMPQALRPVGSSVLVECITDTNLQASPLCGAMEEIEEQFEAENWPALISDSNNRVRWANSAYRQMVGQPECSWLESPASNVHSHSPKVMRINGEVVLMLQRFQIPHNAPAFSCRVKIQWTNGAEKSSMTVPCDVVRSDYGDLKDCFYAWKFDVQAALCL